MPTLKEVRRHFAPENEEARERAKEKVKYKSDQRKLRMARIKAEIELVERQAAAFEVAEAKLKTTEIVYTGKEVLKNGDTLEMTTMLTIT